VSVLSREFKYEELKKTQIGKKEEKKKELSLCLLAFSFHEKNTTTHSSHTTHAYTTILRTKYISDIYTHTKQRHKETQREREREIETLEISKNRRRRTDFSVARALVTRTESTNTRKR